MEIYENARLIGTLELQKEGLYTKFSCTIKPTAGIWRIYLAYPYGSMYLGIPNKNGELKARISNKRVPKDFAAVASSGSKGEWLPWRGQIDGIDIETALVKPDAIAMTLDDAMNFPAWDMETKIIYDTQMAILPLDAEGLPLPTERKGAENETVDFNHFDFDLPADSLADDDLGGQGWEADCADL